jgi:hypothetical protein
MVAPVAQLDRASDFESAGRVFESPRARQDNKGFTGFPLEAFLVGVHIVCMDSCRRMPSPIRHSSSALAARAQRVGKIRATVLGIDDRHMPADQPRAGTGRADPLLIRFLFLAFIVSICRCSSHVRVSATGIWLVPVSPDTVMGRLHIMKRGTKVNHSDRLQQDAAGSILDNPCGSGDHSAQSLLVELIIQSRQDSVQLCHSSFQEVAFPTPRLITLQTRLWPSRTSTTRT